MPSLPITGGKIAFAIVSDALSLTGTVAVAVISSGRLAPSSVTVFVMLLPAPRAANSLTLAS